MPAAKPTDREIQAWILELMSRVGIGTVRFSEKSIGLLHVPAKYAEVINVMHIAMLQLVAGKGLPEFLKSRTRKTRSDKGRGKSPSRKAG